MTILIRGGGVVNHDHSRRADVLLHEGAIAAIGVNLEAPAGAETIDAGGCYVMPGGIDPHTHLEFAFMGTVTADDFEWGTKAALSGGTTTVVDFCIPNPGQSLLAAYQDWRRKAEGATCDYGFHMAITWWDRQVFDEMETIVKTYGINTFKDFMAYKSALMVNDDELYNSFLRCADAPRQGPANMCPVIRSLPCMSPMPLGVNLARRTASNARKSLRSVPSTIRHFEMVL